MAWTLEYARQADLEGWDLFECSDDHDPVELERVDCPNTRDGKPIFNSDVDAWTHVVSRAMLGSLLHLEALWALYEESPGEWLRVLHGAFDLD